MAEGLVPTAGRARPGTGPTLYCLWALLAIGVSIAIAGLSLESLTRLLVIAFLLAQVGMRSILVTSLAGLSPRARFIVMGTLLAAVVEAFHMISTPVFPSLRIGPETPVTRGLMHYALDLLFTAVRDQLRQGRPSGRFAYLAIPALILTYLCCGAAIRLVGRAVGLQTTSGLAVPR